MVLGVALRTGSPYRCYCRAPGRVLRLRCASESGGVATAELPRWGKSSLAQLPGHAERAADALGVDDVTTEEGLAHLAGAGWVVAVAGRCGCASYPVGPAVALDPDRPVAVRVLALLLPSVKNLQDALEGVAGTRFRVRSTSIAGSVPQDLHIPNLLHTCCTLGVKTGPQAVSTRIL